MSYINGFNAAHRLSKFHPELVQKLIPVMTGPDDYTRGFNDGLAEYKKEQEKENRLNEINNIDNAHELNKEPDLER